MSWAVFVATKGRAGRISADVLSLSPTLVVEPAEEAAYRTAYPGLRVRVLEANDRGVSYARNGVLRQAAIEGQDWCWMLDDDLGDFQYRAASGPVSRTPKEALSAAEARIGTIGGCAAAGLSVAWQKPPRLTGAGGRSPATQGATDAVTRGVNVYCCVALGVGELARAGIRYREELALREDTDLALQILAKGRVTARLNELAFQMPMCGTNPGGLAATYAEEARVIAANWRLGELWPDVVTVAPSGKSYRVHWERLSGVPAPPSLVARRARAVRRPAALS